VAAGWGLSERMARNLPGGGTGERNAAVDTGQKTVRESKREKRCPFGLTRKLAIRTIPI